MIGTAPKEVECPHCNGTGKTTIPSEVATVEAYYFGCWTAMGHFWRHPTNSYMNESDIERRIPAALHHSIDSSRCPGKVPGNPYKRRFEEVEGEARLSYVDGWTVLGWWDRSVDHRGNANSNIVARGQWDFASMLEIGRAQFPHIMQRQKRVPVLRETDGTPTAE
jgi:hypothetical protein